MTVDGNDRRWWDRITALDLLAALIAVGIMVALGGQVIFGA